MRFMSTLATIADLLGARGRSAPSLMASRMPHARMGVRAAHFTPMGMALMVTLAETLREEFTPRLQEAWHAAYDATSPPR